MSVIGSLTITSTEWNTKTSEFYLSDKPIKWLTMYLDISDPAVDYLVDGVSVVHIDHISPMRNGGFEGEGAWFCFGGCSLTYTQEEAYEGAWSGKVTGR